MWVLAPCSNGVTTVDMRMAMLSFMASKWSEDCCFVLFHFRERRNDILSPSFLPLPSSQQFGLVLHLSLVGVISSQGSQGDELHAMLNWLAQAFLVLIQLEGTITLFSQLEIGI